MSNRFAKLNAVRARWQKQHRRAEAQLSIAKQALDDLDARCRQLEALQQDYRNKRVSPDLKGPGALATLARFDVDLSSTLEKLTSQRESTLEQLTIRERKVLESQRRLLGLQRYQQRLQESHNLDARRGFRRKLNQVPWRGGVHQVGDDGAAMQQDQNSELSLKDQ